MQWIKLHDTADTPHWAGSAPLYKQTTMIRIHNDKKCQKILRPDSDFSLTIQMWYNQIHAYLQLI